MFNIHYLWRVDLFINQFPAMRMKSLCFPLCAIILSFFVTNIYGQNAIIGEGFSNGWDYENEADWTFFNESAGTSRILITNSSVIGNRFFRLKRGWGDNDYRRTEFRPVLGNNEMYSNFGSAYAPSTGTNGAFYINVSDLNHNYVFKTRRADGNNEDADFVIFEVQSNISTVENVSQSPSLVSPNTPVTITATLSGNLPSGQGVYLRYSDSNYATSNIVEMTGSGTSYEANILESINQQLESISYYVFTSGSGLTISHTDADFFTINLNNNGGSSYNYSVDNIYRSAQSGDWNDTGTWLNSSIPGTYDQVIISSDHTVNANDVIELTLLEIESEGVLNAGISAISISNGFICNGTFNGQNSAVVFDGSQTFTKGNPFFNNLAIGDGQDVERVLYLDDDIYISGDLAINTSSELRPGQNGGTNFPTVHMTGINGNIINNGLIRPLDGEKMLVFSFEGETVLKTSDLAPPGNTQFANITVAENALLRGPNVGVVNIELVTGSVINDGSIIFKDVESSVKIFIAPDQTVSIDAENGLETMLFSLDLGAGSVLQPASNTISTISITENLILNNNSNLQTLNGTGKLNLAFTGTQGPQKIIKTSNTPNILEFQNLTLNTDTALFFEVPTSDAVSFQVRDTLRLQKGLLVTLDISELESTEVRYNLEMLLGAVTDTTNLSDDTHVAGPITYYHQGTDMELIFPIGQGGEYRRLDISGERTSNNGFMELTGEVFQRSAEALDHSIPEPVLNISTNRFWVLFPDDVNKLDSVQVTLHYGGTDDEGVTLPEALRVLGVDRLAVPESTWENLGPSSGGSGAPGTIVSTSFDWSSSTGYDFTLGNVQSGVNPLPVTWLSFSGKAATSTNELYWSTASEQNNDYFDVLRSQNGSAFTSIGAVAGSGNATQRSDYHFTDVNPASGTTYYKLQQFDYDGKSDFSPVIAISRKGEVSVYPNPFRDELQIRIEANNMSDAPARFTIRDATGRIVSHHSLPNGGGSIYTGNLPAGAYLGELTQGDDAPLVFKLIK